LCYTTASVISQRLETARLTWHSLSAAYQQQSFTLILVQQENDWLRTRRFQLQLERGDHLQRILDLEAQSTTLQEDVDAGDIQRLTLLQNITDMHRQVEEAEVQVAALQAIMALQPPPLVEAPPEEK
jgi:chromosome segregation ATPase